MKRILILLQVILLLACGDSKKHGNPPSLALEQQVIAKVQDIRSWSDQFKFDSIVGHEANDGDAAIFNGLLWFSGEEGLVPLSEYLEPSGRPRRNPLRKGIEEANSFSRDQTLGLLAYIVKTNDREMGEKLSQYIVSIGNPQHKWPRSCPEDICIFSPSLYYIYNFVAKQVGFSTVPALTSLADSENPQDLINEYEDELQQEEKEEIVNSTFQDGVFYLSTRFANSGYPLHLSAVTLMLKKHYSWSKLNQKTVNYIYSKEKWNPFYAWLAQGKSQEALQNWLNLAPSALPTCGRVDWILQRTEEDTKKNCSYGWDFIFVSNLFGY